MARVLMAWEMGLNLGHLYPIRQLAQAFVQSGHEVRFALKVLDDSARQILDDCLPSDAEHATTSTLFQAPLPDDVVTDVVTLDHETRNYTDILIQQGFADSEALRNRIEKWSQLFEQTNAEMIVADHAPTAVLAARCAGLPTAVTGIGFLVPPRQSPMPLFRWWQSGPSRAELHRAERTVLASINTCLQAFDKPPLFQVADLLDTEVRALATVPALDDYPERPDDEIYWGIQRNDNMDDTNKADWPGWPQGQSPNDVKVFGYLRRDYPAFRAIIEALNQMPVRALIYVPPGEPAVTTASHVCLHPRPLNVTTGARTCDVAVSYASIGFVSELLAEGKPLLLAPPFVQHAMVAQRVLLAGAGVPGEPFWGVEEYRRELDRLCSDQRYRDKAQGIAQEISSYPSGTALNQRIVEACEQVLTHRVEPGTRAFRS